jgi:hypothetical protein
MNDLKIIELYKYSNFIDFITKNKDISEFDSFVNKLLKETRFFNNNQPVLEQIKRIFDGNTIFLTPDDSLYRARKIKPEDYNFKDEEKNKLSDEAEFYGFDKKNSFVCQEKDAKANRANSIGIPCLYVAREEKTAIAEIRPFLGSEISIAIIRPLRNLKIFDLYFHPEKTYDDIIKPPRSALWLNIAIEFSIPYEESSRNEYLLTQCLSEYFQQEGFDGIQYSSSLYEGGRNIAIFNCRHEDDGGEYNICEPVCSTIKFIKSVDYYVTS